MRIVAGEFRGRQLAGPGRTDIRPTGDRVRESVFNIIAHNEFADLAGARVLDLFAGTGALGLEAVSRGASMCLFVEQSATARAVIRNNVEALGLQGRTKIYRRDATIIGKAGTMAPFDMVFADPPYGQALGPRAAISAREGGWLKPGALLVLEEALNMAPDVIDGFELLDKRTIGETVIGFFRNS